MTKIVTGTSLQARVVETQIVVGTDLPEVGDLILDRSEPDRDDGLPIYNVRRTVSAVQLLVTAHDAGSARLDQLRDRIEDLADVIQVEVVTG
jgi:hypothetical protein